MNDHEAEVYWHLRAITLDSATYDKLVVLSTLVPALAKLAHSKAAAILEKLKVCFKLRGKDLSGLEADVRGERKAQEKKSGSSTPAPALKDLEDVRRLHPAIDFHGDFMSIGFRVDLLENNTGLLLVISNGRGVWPEITPEQIEVDGQTYQMNPGAPPFLREVWGLEILKAFLAHPSYVQFYEELKNAYLTFLELPEHRLTD